MSTEYIPSKNAEAVLKKRYLQYKEDGTLETPNEMLRRVAKTMAAQEPRDQEEWEEKFFELMANQRAFPNTPCLLNAGKEKGFLSACTILPVEDSIERIFQSAKDCAQIQQRGAGVGYSFSKLRPKGARISSTRGTTSGVCSFMDVFEVTVDRIQQGASRRGSQMGVLDYWHPEIWDFIHAKENLDRWNNFNVSVMVTDYFMQQVESNSPAPLVVKHPAWGEGYLIDSSHGVEPVLREDYKGEKQITIPRLFDEICRLAHQNGEPGLLFFDSINKDNFLADSHGPINAVNVCGEIPGRAGTTCCIGSINLQKYYITEVGFNFDSLAKDIHTLVRFLDNLIDANVYPVKLLEDYSKNTREIGLGVMGWANLLFKMELPYNHPEAIRQAEELSSFIASESYKASHELAKEKGHYPCWNSSHGVERRNATLNTIAPTGSVSILADTSGGCEPVFSLAYERHIMVDKDKNHTVLHEVNPIFRNRLFEEIGAEGAKETIAYAAKHGSIQNFTPSTPIKGDWNRIRDVFLTARDISVEDHIDMQAAWQKHIDKAVSKSINMIHEAPVEDVRAAFLRAWQVNNKGITVYRDGCREAQPMQLAEKEKSLKPKELIKVPEIAPAIKIKQQTPFGSLHVKVVYLDDLKKPIEVFAQLGKAGDNTYADIEGMCRLISLHLRSGGRIQDIIKQLTEIGSILAFPTKYGKVRSIPDGLGKALLRYTNMFEEKKPLTAGSEKDYNRKCPECQSPIIQESGCERCSNESCGWYAC